MLQTQEKPQICGPAAASAAAAGTAWHVLAVLSVLMGFASISTDFYLPAMPAMAAALHAGHQVLIQRLRHPILRHLRRGLVVGPGRLRAV